MQARAERDTASKSREASDPKAQSDSPTPDGEAGFRVFFIGNSFTLQGPIPDLIGEFADQSGFANVHIDFRAVNGQSLAWHRADQSATGAPARLREGWDVVVLQDYSTRPTDSLGAPRAFKQDATWFYERAREANPNARVVLYETWARRAGHPVYSGGFSSPAAMQSQLRTHYQDAADRYIPAFSRFAPGEPVRVAPVGDAWELQLGRDPSMRLHASDDYHAGAAGQYLSAAVLFSTIFDKPASGLPAIHVSQREASKLQKTADAVTGFGPTKTKPRAPESSERRHSA